MAFAQRANNGMFRGQGRGHWKASKFTQARAHARVEGERAALARSGQPRTERDTRMEKYQELATLLIRARDRGKGLTAGELEKLIARLASTYITLGVCLGI